MKIGRDKYWHFGISAFVALLAAAIFSIIARDAPTAFLAAVCIALAVGVGKEYGDHCAPGNAWSWGDLIADIAGAIAGAAAAWPICLAIP